jgi:hypothetical protein
MNCDYQICVPQKISCGFLASFIFWISIIAVAVVSIVSGSAIFFGLERVDFPYDPSQIGLQFSWFLLLVIGLLVPIVIVDMYGSKNQRNCAGFALVIALVLVTASSVSFEISMYWYAFVGYLISVVLIFWLAYLSYRSTKGGKLRTVGSVSAVLASLFILTLAFSILERGIINPPQNVDPKDAVIRSVNFGYFKK